MTKDSVDYERLARIVAAIGDVDSLKVLNHAVKGFKSGKTTIKELNLSSRKYYRTLKVLLDAQLIRVNENNYRLTPSGRVLHRLLFSNLNGFLDVSQSSLDYLEEISKSKEMTVIDDYNDLVAFLVDVVSKSKSEILLATRFIDFSVIQGVSNALDRNIKVNTLNDTKLDYPGFFKLIEGIHRDIRPSVANFFVEPDKHYRSVQVPFSFIVIDKEVALFEIPNKQFRMAFVTTDKQIVKSITEFFWELWEQSKSLGVPNW